MSTPLTSYRNSWKQRLLLFVCVLAVMPVALARLLINPQFLTTYFLESNITNENAVILLLPSLSMLKAIHYCAPGASKTQILTLLGAPRFKEMKLMFPGCGPDLCAADEVWFYEVAPQELIFVGFKGDHCNVARTFSSFKESEGYETWKVEQIQKLAAGQTQAEMEAWLGKCFIENPEFVRLVLIVTGNVNAAQSPWTDIPGRIYTNGGCGINIEMRSGRFVKASSFVTFH